MRVLKILEIGTAYKLINNVLMFTPLDNENNLSGKDWNEVDFFSIDEIDGYYPNQALLILKTTTEEATQ